MLRTENHSSLVEKQLEMSKYIGQRKHGSSIAKLEMDSLWERLREVDKWDISPHALDRLTEKGINATYEDIVSTIHNAILIEYKIDYLKNINRCDERIVLRSNAIVNFNYNLHVVYSLVQKKVITVWMNHKKDLHKTLDWNLYSEDMKVFGI